MNAIAAARLSSTRRVLPGGSSAFAKLQTGLSSTGGRRAFATMRWMVRSVGKHVEPAIDAHREPQVRPALATESPRRTGGLPVMACVATTRSAGGLDLLAIPDEADRSFARHSPKEVVAGRRYGSQASSHSVVERSRAVPHHRHPRFAARGQEAPGLRRRRPAPPRIVPRPLSSRSRCPAEAPGCTAGSCPRP